LWHKIFGSPAEPSIPASEESAGELAVPSDIRDEPRAAGSGFADPHADEPMTLFDETIEEEIYTERSVGEEEEEPARPERPRGRSRRGRGVRGRGRESDDRPAGRRREEHGERPSRPARSDSDIDDDFVEDQLGEDLADEALDDEAAEVENGSVAGGGAGPRSSSALQRAIPSWDEAIGFIVDSNLQTRSQRRPSRGGGRDSSSRGRGRGRRGS
jgi:hypothetical protein